MKNKKDIAKEENSQFASISPLGSWFICCVQICPPLRRLVDKEPPALSYEGRFHHILVPSGTLVQYIVLLQHGKLLVLEIIMDLIGGN